MATLSSNTHQTDSPLWRRGGRVLRSEGPWSLLRKGWAYLASRFVRTPWCAWRIRRLPPAASIPSMVDFAMDACWQTIRPAQAREEIIVLLELLQARAPRRVVEIGTARGGTFFLFARVAAADATLISVDLPRGQFMGGYPAWRSALYRVFARGRQQVRLIRADSHQPSTRVAVERELSGAPIDFLFIDGDHTYDGVAQDFAMYSPLVAPGGVVAFHDILAGRAASGGEVHKFWQEIKGRYEHREIVSDWQRGSAGLGVLIMPQAAASAPLPAAAHAGGNGRAARP